MRKVLDKLLFQYKLFSCLLKYIDPINKEEIYLLNYIIKKLYDEINSFDIKDNSFNLLCDEINNIDLDLFYDNQSKYNYYIDLLLDDQETLNKYISAKKKIYIGSVNKQNYLSNIKNNNNFFFLNIKFYNKFISDFFISNFLLFIISLYIILTTVFNIILNTSNITDSISEHGTISNMVDLHSSFAIVTKLLVILNFIFCLFLLLWWIITYNTWYYMYNIINKIVLNIIEIYFILYLINIIYSLYFLFTGFVWAEFTWGGKIWKFESKMIQLSIHILLNTLFCYIFFFHRKSSFFFMLNLILITSFISFIFFLFYDSVEQPYSVHQNTDSLHLFLRFVGAGTGYYVVIFVIYLFYLFFSRFIMEYELKQLIIKDPAIRFYSKLNN